MTEESYVVKNVLSDLISNAAIFKKQPNTLSLAEV